MSFFLFIGRYINCAEQRVYGIATETTVFDSRIRLSVRIRRMEGCPKMEEAYGRV